MLHDATNPRATNLSRVPIISVPRTLMRLYMPRTLMRLYMPRTLMRLYMPRTLMRLCHELSSDSIVCHETLDATKCHVCHAVLSWVMRLNMLHRLNATKWHIKSLKCVMCAIWLYRLNTTKRHVCYEIWHVESLMCVMGLYRVSWDFTCHELLSDSICHEVSSDSMRLYRVSWDSIVWKPRSGI